MEQGVEHPAVLIAGGRGYVGSLLAQGLVASGHSVIATGRRRAEPTAAERPAVDAGLLTLVHTPDLADAEGSAAAVRSTGHRIGAVIACLGGWALEGPLLALPLGDWQRTLQSHLTGHLLAARAFAPLLPPRAAYVLLNGAASRRPMADAGSISVTGAAQAMLLRVLNAQAGAGDPRFHEVVLMAAVAGDDRNLDPVEEITPAAVVAAVARVLGDPGAPESLLVEAG